MRVALPKKGFEIEESKSHIYFYFKHDGRECGIETHISHNSDDIRDPLAAKMARQLKISKQEFVDLVECPLDYAAYVEKLRAVGYLKRPSSDPLRSSAAAPKPDKAR